MTHRPEASEPFTWNMGIWGLVSRWFNTVLSCKHYSRESILTGRWGRLKLHPFVWDPWPREECLGSLWECPRDSRDNRHTNKGWKLLVAWKDGTTSYVLLKEMKNAFPLETADYVVKWWVPSLLKKKDCIIGKRKKSKLNIDTRHISMEWDYIRQFSKG